MSKIIIIEDDIYLREELVNTFSKKGYSVTSISCFACPEQEILDSNPDLAVLDVNLPGKSGYELCKWLKSKANFPILILTARAELSDELFALGLGADDFLTKPCHPDRLLARVEKLLKMYGKMRNLIQVGELALDVDSYEIMWKDTHIVLPETEGRILQKLIEKYPSLVSKQELFSCLWGGDEFVDENILQVNITRLRKNLDVIGIRDIVQTIRGQGYCLKVGDT